MTGSELSNEADEFTLARKAANECMRRPYRKPTQVGRKKILRPTGEGVPAERQAAEKRPKRLFNKNTGLCEIER